MAAKVTEGIYSGRAIGVGFLLIVFCLLSSTAARQKSPTFDEPLHLFAGYSYLKWGDFRINPEHPPLAKTLAALPLLGLDIDTSGITPGERDAVGSAKNYSWILAARFVLANHNVQNLFMYPRLIMTGLAAILGLFVYLWAREFYGTRAGLAAMGIYCFDPNVLAQSSIIHTDIPFTLCFFAGSYFYWRAAHNLTWKDLFATSLLFGLAAIVKFSFLVILPIWIALAFLRAWSTTPHQSQITLPRLVCEPRQKLALHSLILITAIVMAFLAIWAAYGFRFDAAADATEQLRIGRVIAPNSWLSMLAVANAKYFILPEAWLYGLFDAVRASDRVSYLSGQIYQHGSWLYFPVVFAVKTPLPTLVMLLAAIILAVRRRSAFQMELFLLLPAVLFFFLAASSRLNIGLRHILPIYPFLFVWIGGMLAAIWTSGDRVYRWGAALLGVFLLASSLWTYPDYLAFFNELAGGPGNGHNLLVDSNLDWGQDLKGLQMWMKNQGVTRIQLAYFGTIDPAYYGIDADYLQGTHVIQSRPKSADAPVPSHIAISATYLQGLYLQNRDRYAAYRDQKPVAVIGHSIWVFKLNP